MAGVAVNVTFVPAQMVLLGASDTMLTLAGNAAFTVIFIVAVVEPHEFVAVTV